MLGSGKDEEKGGGVLGEDVTRLNLDLKEGNFLEKQADYADGPKRVTRASGESPCPVGSSKSGPSLLKDPEGSNKACPRKSR